MMTLLFYARFALWCLSRGELVLKLELALFLYRYRTAFKASRPHKPPTLLKTKIPETDLIADKEPGWTWCHQ